MGEGIKKISEQFKARSILEELYYFFTRIISGMVVITSILFLLRPDYQIVLNLIKQIIDLNTLLFWVVTLSSLYIAGLLSTNFFDSAMSILSFILGLFNKHKIKRLKPFTQSLFDYFWIKSILVGESRIVSESYKNKIITTLNKNFEINSCYPIEIYRLAREFCIRKGLVKHYKWDHSFSLLKGIFNSLLILVVLSIRSYNWAATIFLVIALISVLKEIHNNSITVQRRYLDSAIMYFSFKTKKA